VALERKDPRVLEMPEDITWYASSLSRTDAASIALLEYP
jgi:hypothetical protein